MLELELTYTSETRLTIPANVTAGIRAWALETAESFPDGKPPEGWRPPPPELVQFNADLEDDAEFMLAYLKRVYPAHARNFTAHFFQNMGIGVALAPAHLTVNEGVQNATPWAPQRTVGPAKATPSEQA